MGGGGAPSRSAPGTIQLLVATLRAALGIAKRNGRLVQLPEFPTVIVRNARQGFFEKTEFDRLLPHLEDDDADVATFGYLTGWRINEILPLRASNVDLTAAVLRIADSKTGEGRSLSLVGELKTLIEKRLALRRVDHRIVPWLFHKDGRPISYGGFHKRWRRACERAGLPGKFFHDLRRTVARDLIAAGGDYGTAMSITGHKTMGIFQRYQIKDTRQQAVALERAFAFRAAQRADPDVAA